MEKKINKKEILKILLIIGSTIVVSIIFYNIGHYFGYRAHLLTPSHIDNLIPWNTHFIYFYVSWHIMLIIVPFVLGIKDNKIFQKYINSVFICLLIALLIFIIYPTIMERPELIVKTFSDKLYSFILIFSSPTKCIPSLHVALSTLFVFGTFASKNVSKTYKIVILIISFGIILSTMFLKQHYFVDVYTGIIVGSISWLIGSKVKHKILFDNKSKKL